jgi:GAF domain-containing protein
MVPIKNSAREVVAMPDIDSKDLNSFDEIDAFWLEKIVALI